MKMTKQVKTMVESVNNYLKENNIHDGNNEMFSITSYLLIQAGCYHGFNFFNESGRIDKTGFLQFYIV